MLNDNTPTIDDCKAAIAELNAQVATLSMRAVDMAVILAQINKELIIANIELEKFRSAAISVKESKIDSSKKSS